MSEPINDGGPAFPNNDAHGCAFPGMTLRDWFAGQALAGFMAHPDNEMSFQWTNSETRETRLLPYGSNPAGGGPWVITRTPAQAMAQHIWSRADAMLAARERKEAAHV